MRLRVIVAAEWKVLAPVDRRGRCGVLEVLSALEFADKVAHDEVVTLLARIPALGPPRDPRRSRYLGGSVYELKTTNGWRLFYFFDRGRIIVCAELRRKPKGRELRMIVLQARELRARYLAARDANDIVEETDA